MNTACHIRNLCPSTAIGDKIPLELWKGKGCDIQGEINRLRLLGCKVWYLKSPGEVKFDSRPDKGIFVGYDRQVKGYRIYLPKTKKVILSCHVEVRGKCVSSMCEWIWDVEDFELQGGDDTSDIEAQSEEESDYYMNNLINENNQEEVVSVPTVPRRSARLHKPKTRSENSRVVIEKQKVSWNCTKRVESEDC